jgi:hypothetical protein
MLKDFLLGGQDAQNLVQHFFLCTGELYYVPFRSLLISTMYVWAGEGGRERGGWREREGIYAVRVQLEF